MGRKKRLQTLDELKLCPKSKRKVQKWLETWLSHLIEQAGGQQGNVYKADFLNMDFFYFTNCQDILAADPLLKDPKNQRKMRWRKSNVLVQLFVKSLLGRQLAKKRPCTHCGAEDTETLYCQNGYWIWCKKCKRVILDTYAPDFSVAAISVLEQLRANGEA